MAVEQAGILELDAGTGTRSAATSSPRTKSRIRLAHPTSTSDCARWSATASGFGTGPSAAAIPLSVSPAAASLDFRSGKKSDAAKVSLAVAFLAAGGATAGGASAAGDNPEAVVSSYFGGYGLRDNFEGYLKVNTGFTGFYKYWKFDQFGAVDIVIKFSLKYDIQPPPGFEIPD